MDINEKAITENMADMQLEETSQERPEEPVVSPGKNKRPCKQGLKPKMRLYMRMNKDMDSTLASSAPWGAGVRQPFGPKRGPGPWMNHPGMQNQWPMMYSMQGPVGPVWNAPIMHGPMWNRQSGRRHPGCQHVPPGFIPERHMMMFAGPENFDNHPFFMRRKFWKMANAHKHQGSKTEPSKKGDNPANQEKMEQDPDFVQPAKAPGQPFVLHALGYPPFMMTGWKRWGRNKKQQQKEASKAEPNDATLSSEEEGVADTAALTGDRSRHQVADAKKQGKHQCLNRKRMRKMMIMQMMMQHTNPFMNPWMASVPQARRGGCCKRLRKNMEKAADDRVNDPAMTTDSPAGENVQQKQCKPGCQRRKRIQRMMMLQNMNPFVAQLMGIPPPHRGRRGKHQRQPKEQQNGEDADVEKMKAPDMVRPEENERLQAEEPLGDAKPQHKECQPGWQHKRRMQRIMRMMQQSAPFMAPWKAAWLQAAEDGVNKHGKQGKNEVSDGKDCDVEDDVDDYLSLDDTPVEQGVGDQTKKAATKKRPGCCPQRRRRMKMMRAMQQQGYGHYPFMHPWMFRAGPKFAQNGNQSGC